MDWLRQNTDLISAVGTFGMFLVWVVYAQLFYKDYRRRRRPRIIIDDMSGPGAASTCTVVNLSNEVVYLECVLAVATTSDGEHCAPVTEHTPISTAEHEDREIVSHTRQGPLPPGKLIAVGTIEEMARIALGTSNDEDVPVRDLECVEIRIIATMSSEDKPVGASKRFDLFDEGKRSRAAHVGTHQLYGRREKRQVLSWLMEHWVGPGK